MPEGPEVKRCGDVLRGILKDKVVVKASALSGKLQRLGVLGLNELKLPLKINNVYTIGKVIFIQTLNDKMILSTLGMSGWWYPPASQLSPTDTNGVAYYQGKMLRVGDVVKRAESYARFALETEDGSLALYTDPRNFGNLKVLPDVEGMRVAQGLGVDFFNEPCAYGSAVMALKRKPNKAIGEVLLDQSLIAGIGNIYRAEVLYAAGISPFRLVSDLSSHELDLLVKAVETVLKVSYHQEGTMTYTTEFLAITLGRHPGLIDKLRSLGRRAGGLSYIERMLCYGYKIDIFGYNVQTAKLGGRTIWYVPEVQR